MATLEELQREQERLELIQQQNKAAKELVSTYEKMAKTVNGLSADEKETLDIAKQISKYSSEIEKSISKRKDKSASLVSLTSSLNKLQSDYKKNLDESAKTQANLNKQYLSSVRIGSQIAETLKEEIEIQNIAENQLTQQEQAYQRLLTAKASGQRISKTQLDLAKLNLDNAQKEYDVSKKLVNELVERKKEQDTYTKQLIDTKKAHEEILEQQRKEVIATKEAVVQSALQSVANKLQIGQLMTLSGLWTFILNATFKVDKQLTDLGKSIGISKNAARELRNEFAQYTALSKDGFINTERLVKAQLELTEQLGFGAKFSAQELETFSRLTEIVGLTAQEASKFNQFSAAAGMSSTDYVKNIRSAAFFAQQANKINISDKELLSSISKLSAGILVKFQNNPKAIAEAVVQAKKLGTTLEQVDKTASSLLNFESSIEAELEAELLTGRKLNFERARAAALTGDQATLMEEMAAQAGSLAEFQGMNVLAQESLAKAFGMSREEMADMLMKQEAINSYGDKAAELNAQQLKDFEKSGLSLDAYLAKQKEQQNIQEKFNNAITKLQELIGNLVEGPLGKFLNIVADILGNTTALSAIIGVLIGSQIPGMIKGFTQVAKVIKSAAKFSIAEALAKAAASVSSVPVVGWALAGGVVAGLGALLYGYLADDLLSAPAGYGKRTLTTPEGTFKLNDRDTVLAGTDLGAGRAKSESNAGVMAAISNLATAMNKPAPAPQFALNVDGQQLGSVVGRQAETGTQQTKNAYRLA
jgi:hypothetical protein